MQNFCSLTTGKDIFKTPESDDLNNLTNTHILVLVAQ